MHPHSKYQLEPTIQDSGLLSIGTDTWKPHFIFILCSSIYEIKWPDKALSSRHTKCPCKIKIVKNTLTYPKGMSLSIAVITLIGHSYLTLWCEHGNCAFSDFYSPSPFSWKIKVEKMHPIMNAWVYNLQEKYRLVHFYIYCFKLRRNWHHC